MISIYKLLFNKNAMLFSLYIRLQKNIDWYAKYLFAV